MRAGTTVLMFILLLIGQLACGPDLSAQTRDALDRRYSEECDRMRVFECNAIAARAAGDERDAERHYADRQVVHERILTLIEVYEERFGERPWYIPRAERLPAQVPVVVQH